MNVAIQPEQFSKILLQAMQNLEGSVHALQEVKMNLGEDKLELYHIQLLLQYRLDLEDALKHLLQLDNATLQLLGINPHQSSHLNLERLRYTLGSEDLKLVLSMLQQLLERLQKISKRLQNRFLLEKATSKPLSLDTPQAHSANSKRLHTALGKEQTMRQQLEALTKAIESIGGQPKPGPTLDHIAALEGPISRFYQALQHGIVTAYGLCQKAMTNAKLNLELKAILQKAEETLLKIQGPNLKSQFFSTQSPEKKLKELEARALEKRLGHFFNH